MGDFCHKRSIRCKPSPKPDSCENCVDFGLPCTYNRPIKRGRGRQKPPDEPVGTNNSVDITTDHNAVLLQPSGRSQSETTVESSLLVGSALPDASWKAFASVSHSLIIYLIDIYFQVVYPMSVQHVLIISPYSNSQGTSFPFFDRQSLLDRIDRQVHLEDRDFFATLMSACAIAAGRVEDGSVPSSISHQKHQPVVKPSIFFAAAEESLPHDIIKAASLDALKAYPLLALAAIQGQKIEVMHKYIGQYFAILSIKRWHDEENWPKRWTSMERDEMRRVVSEHVHVVAES